MEAKIVGVSSQYAVTTLDAAGNYLDGANNNKLNLPPNVTAKNFWSVMVYDLQTRSMISSGLVFLF